MKRTSQLLAALTLVTAFAVTPAMASAQSLKDIERLIDRREDKKDEWRTIATASAGLAILGLLKKDNTLTFAGTAGALYSAYRYEEDRKSASKLNKTRAAFFSRDHFYRDGQRFNRETVYVKGKKHYRFVRAKKSSPGNSAFGHSQGKKNGKAKGRH